MDSIRTDEVSSKNEQDVAGIRAGLDDLIRLLAKSIARRLKHSAAGQHPTKARRLKKVRGGDAAR